MNKRTSLKNSFLSLFNLKNKPAPIIAPPPPEPEITESMRYKNELTNLLTPLPDFAKQINKALSQLDTMSKKSAILTDILKRNKSDCPDLIVTCDETNGIINQNIRGVINRLTIASGVDRANPKAIEHFTKHANAIEKFLVKNYSILDSFNDFLVYAANMKDKVIEEDVGLKASIAALKQMY